MENDPDAGSRDGRNLLVLPIAEVAKELQPTFVVVENVPAFLRRKGLGSGQRDSLLCREDSLQSTGV